MIESERIRPLNGSRERPGRFVLCRMQAALERRGIAMVMRMGPPDEGVAEAHRIALRLNSRYELDGRDQNGLAGVAWRFGPPERPRGERAIFGTVRCMNAAGLRREFDADAYVKKINELSDCRIR